MQAHQVTGDPTDPVAPGDRGTSTDAKGAGRNVGVLGNVDGGQVACLTRGAGSDVDLGRDSTDTEEAMGLMLALEPTLFRGFHSAQFPRRWAAALKALAARTKHRSRRHRRWAALRRRWIVAMPLMASCRLTLSLRGPSMSVRRRHFGQEMTPSAAWGMGERGGGERGGGGDGVGTWAGLEGVCKVRCLGRRRGREGRGAGGGKGALQGHTARYEV